MKLRMVLQDDDGREKYTCVLDIENKRLDDRELRYEFVGTCERMWEDFRDLYFGEVKASMS